MRCITFASGRTSGEKFFTYLWTELFDDFTIDIYRVRSMNSKTILEELLEVTCRVEEGTWDINNVKLVSCEAIKLIENDRVLKNTNFYSSLVHIIGALATNNLPEAEFTKIKILLESIINKLRNTYYDKLVQGLTEEINQGNYDGIEWYTNAVATEVIQRGYSTSYINKISKKLYGTKSFMTCLNSIIKSLGGDLEEYIVYFSITSNIHEHIPNKVLDVSFLDKIDVETSEKASGFTVEQANKKFGKVSINCVDSDAAAMIARAKLSTSLDLISFGLSKNTNFINVGNKCLVIGRSEFQDMCNSEIMLTGYSKNDDSKLDNVDKMLSKIIVSASVTENSKNKIKSAFRYFRLSKEANNIEHKFLNLWIALEQLVKASGSHASLIGPVVDYIPKCMAIGYVSWVIRDVLENIARCRVNVSDTLTEYLDKSNKERFIELMRNEELYSKLIDEVKVVSPLLEYRIIKLKDELSKSSGIQKFIEKFHTEIDYQLVRMYRTRNRIVHGAAFDLTISGLTSSLLLIVNNIINIILFEMDHYSELDEILKVLLKYKFTYVQHIANLKGDKKNLMDLQIIINPLNLMWP
jgi:hypothetical protein